MDDYTDAALSLKSIDSSLGTVVFLLFLILLVNMRSCWHQSVIAERKPPPREAAP